MIKSRNSFILILVLALLLIGIALYMINKNQNIHSAQNNFTNCKESQRNAEACIEIYAPVCGYVQVECIKAPCNPVQETFSNSCFACSNSRVLYYSEGVCNEKS